METRNWDHESSLMLVLCLMVFNQLDHICAMLVMLLLDLCQMLFFCCLCSSPWLSTNLITSASCSAFCVLISTASYVTHAWFWPLPCDSHADSWSLPYAGHRRDQEAEWPALDLHSRLVILPLVASCWFLSSSRSSVSLITAAWCWSFCFFKVKKQNDQHEADVTLPPLHDSHPSPSSLSCSWQSAWSLLPNDGNLAFWCMPTASTELKYLQLA